MSRILRSLVCLLLICCILVNLSPLKAQASAAGAIGIIKASTVTGNPYVITAALLIALGIYAGFDSGAFETVANNCVDALEAAGTWIKGGVTELLRTEDADGNASYYVDSGLMEDVRSWVFSSSVIKSVPSSYSISTSHWGSGTITCPYPFQVFWFSIGETYYMAGFCGRQCYANFASDDGLTSSLYFRSAYNDVYYCSVSQGTEFTCSARYLGSFSGTEVSVIKSIFDSFYGGQLAYFSDYDLSFGSLPGQTSDLTDGTSARQWSEDYTDRGLKVYGGGSGNNNNDGKWFWKLMLPLTAADLLLMSQADEWSGETPKEFDDYTTVEELEIVSRPEVEFGQGLELAPVTSPSPDPGTGTNPGTGDGTDTDPDTGTDSGNGSGDNTGTNTGTNTGNNSWTPSGDMQHFTLDLKEYFPFCIPFDLYDFFTCLNADPVAPVIEWVIPLPGGDTYPLELDLSTFDPVAQLLRRLQLLLFCVGLAFKTRDLIKG